MLEPFFDEQSLHLSFFWFQITARRVEKSQSSVDLDVRAPNHSLIEVDEKEI